MNFSCSRIIDCRNLFNKFTDYWACTHFDCPTVRKYTTFRILNMLINCISCILGFVCRWMGNTWTYDNLQTYNIVIFSEKLHCDFLIVLRISLWYIMSNIVFTFKISRILYFYVTSTLKVGCFDDVMTTSYNKSLVDVTITQKATISYMAMGIEDDTYLISNVYEDKNHMRSVQVLRQISPQTIYRYGFWFRK